MQTASTVNTHARLSYRINGNEIFSQARFQNDIQKVVDRFSLVPFENKKKRLIQFPKKYQTLWCFMVIQLTHGTSQMEKSEILSGKSSSTLRNLDTLLPLDS